MSAAPAAPRKRNRKRKRRAASASSSSSSSDSSSSEDEAPAVVVPAKDASSESSSSSSSDSSDSDSDSDVPKPKHVPEMKAQPAARRASPSPPPAEISIPSFLPSTKSPEHPAKEQEMKAKFRKFWMASLADGFSEDLEEVRKLEPNLTKSRLALLIESLASGSDVFSTSSAVDGNNIDEMDVVLE
ncbi:hypothetical protein C8J56DRAFT_1044781 [Mycena floridula]|nr:hypothetical protein C8J56DRAFT_1044781 [Mycena floridula]